MKILVLLFILFPAFTFAAVDLVKVDKSANKMYLYDGHQAVRQYHVAFGGEPKGHKKQEGDQRTPEGRYTLDYKKKIPLTTALCMLATQMQLILNMPDKWACHRVALLWYMASVMAWVGCRC